MSESGKIKVGISIGDPHGVGIEIILKAFEDKRMFDFFIPVVYGNTKLLLQQRSHLKINIGLFTLRDHQTPNPTKLNVVDVWKHDHKVVYGEVSEAAGKLAVASLEAATTALTKDEVSVLVTAPIHKQAIQSDHFKFPGHTDYLASKLGGESLMFMITDSLKVALVSDHIPVKEVSKVLTPERLQHKINLLEKSLKQDFAISRPKIAVLGINPHTGDNGVIGDEDDTVIRPVIAGNIEKGRLVYGPYAADSFFGTQSYLKFDAVLAIYHDQGLIPFKTLSFGNGVNFTAGLTKVRTSPDHGTAFEIAGKGEAKTDSFKEALFKAKSIFFNRNSE